MNVITDFFRSYCSKRTAKNFLIGLSCGIPFLLTTNILDMWLKTEGISNTMIGLFAILHFPYTFKFLIAPLTDKISPPWIFKKLGQRRGWAIFAQILLFVGLVGIAFSPFQTNIQRLIFFILLSSLANGIQDVTLYTYQFDRAKQEDYGMIASVITMGFRIGMFIAKSMTLYIAYYINWSAAYVTMAITIFISMVFILLVQEPVLLETPEEIEVQKLTKTFSQKHNKEKPWLFKLKMSFYECLVCPAKIFIKNRNWILYLLLIMLYKAGDIMLQKMAKPFYIELGFSTLEIANIVQVFGTISSFIGAFVGGYLLKRNELKTCMFYTSLVHALVSFSLVILSYTGKNVPILYAIVFVEFSTGSAMTSCFLAFLYSLCRTASPTTQYALLWGAHEFMGMLVRVFAGSYADMVGWTSFFITLPIMFLPGIVILKMLITREKNDENSQQQIA